MHNGIVQLPSGVWKTDWVKIGDDLKYLNVKSIHLT